MTDYVCPKEIVALFDDPEREVEGRWRSLDWASDLDLKMGDRVWLPEFGWTEKVAPRRGN